MPRTRDLLQRFRFSGTPGAAPGVPADRASEAAAELAPVLALLDAAQEQARRIRADGLHEAARVRGQAEADAEQRVVAARAAAEQVRASAAAGVARRAAAHEAEMLSAARREAALVHERASARTPQYVDMVVKAVTAAILDGGQ